MIASSWLSRMTAAFRLVAGFRDRRSQDAELDEELQFHVDQATARNVRRGLSPTDARRSAVIALGGRAQWTEATRDEQRSRLLDDFARDLRYGAASLRRNIGFATGGVLTIALAIAATTTVFNFVSAVYLRALAVPEGNRLVRIHGNYGPREEEELGFPAFQRLRERAKSLDMVVAHYSTAPLYMVARGETGEVPGAVVSADYFNMLGLRPVLGRFFLQSEDSVPDRDAVAVIGYGLWRSRFGADPQVVGENVTINGRAFTVIGVAPQNFDGIGGGLVNAMWIPTMMLRTGYRWCNAFEFSCAITSIMGRLAPGASLVEAQAELAALRASLVDGADSANMVRQVTVEPATGIRAQEQRQFTNLSKLLWAIAMVLLLVACANLAGLLLARGMARRKEFALRASLGAARWRIVRQLLAECLILGVAGGIAGVAIAIVTSRALANYFASEYRRLAMPLDMRVLAFVVLAMFVSVVLFGLFPALRVSRVDVSEALKTGSSSRSNNRARAVLVAGQAVLAVLLLTAAGLLSRSFDRVLAGGPFDPTHIAEVRLSPRRVGYTAEQSMAYFKAAMHQVRSLNGVVSAAPVQGSLEVQSEGTNTATVALPGDVPVSGDNAPRVPYFVVGDGFFATLRVSMIAGREFTDRDIASTPLVALVNESLALRLWKTTDVLDRTLVLKGISFQVVGVVKNYRPHAFGESPPATAYIAYWQNAFGPPFDARVAIRVTGDPLLALTPIRHAIEKADASVPVTELSSMEVKMRASYAEVRLGGAVLVAAAMLTLFLAAVGLYGVVSYLVAQRSREIAVRLAVGAKPFQVVALVLRQGLRPIGVGGVLGLLLSVAAAPLLSRWLFGIAPTDATTIGASLVAVLVVAVLASYIPARRAAGTDPATVFRSD